MLGHIKILATIIVLLLLPGLVQYVQAAEVQPQEERVLTPYPQNAQLAYMQSCVGEMRALIPYCKCMLSALEKRYTIDEMLRITQVSTSEQQKYADAVAKHCAGN